VHQFFDFIRIFTRNKNKNIEMMTELNSDLVDSKPANAVDDKSKPAITMHGPHKGSLTATLAIERSEKVPKHLHEDDMESLRKRLTTQMKLNDDLKSSLKDCIEEKKKLENDLIKLKPIASRKVKSASNNEIEYLRTENNRLQKEVESLKRLVTDAENKSTTRELKMKRALEDFYKMKNALSESNINSGRKWDESDDLIRTLRENIRELETQKKDLITGFKKQMLLIDVLKKLKEHLEACIKLEVVDKDFSTALEL
jgi:hypothetical protein